MSNRRSDTYDRGGDLSPGWSILLNRSGRPERVLPPPSAVERQEPRGEADQ